MPLTKPLSKPAGLVLAGGRSTRLGTDKSQLLLKNMPLHQLAHEKLSPFCTDVFYSINKSQTLSVKNWVLDKYDDQGPLSGILSALEFMHKPLLVMAVDMPVIQRSTIELLLKQHRPNNKVTAYFNTEKQLWEGLVSIWEPSILTDLATFFDGDGRSLQKFLHQINAFKVPIIDASEFRSINTALDLDYFGIKDQLG
jgi:molybdopterin-guanine dinucleotide biosynthesis protein A